MPLIFCTWLARSLHGEITRLAMSEEHQSKLISAVVRIDRPRIHLSGDRRVSFQHGDDKCKEIEVVVNLSRSTTCRYWFL